MKNVAFYFFFTSVTCVTLGMFWGIQMAISNDHLLAAAHAHLNLVGWVTMGLFGVYYAITPTAAKSKMALIHYFVALAGVAVMIPGIVLTLQNINHAVAAIGSILTALSMLIFLVTVFKNGIGERS